MLDPKGISYFGVPQDPSDELSYTKTVIAWEENHLRPGNQQNNHTYLG